MLNSNSIGMMSRLHPLSQSVQDIGLSATRQSVHSDGDVLVVGGAWCPRGALAALR